MHQMKYLIIQSLNVSNIKKKLIVMIKFEKEVKLAYFLINIIMRYNALIDKVNEILLITIWQTKNRKMSQLVCMLWSLSHSRIFLMFVSSCLHSGFMFPPSTWPILCIHKQKTLWFKHTSRFTCISEIWFSYIVKLAHKQRVNSYQHINHEDIHSGKWLTERLFVTLTSFNCIIP